MKKQDTKTSPPVKVVGFRVEGATPSPRDSSLADAANAPAVTGSPSPVIIPPAFSGRASGSGGGDTTPTLRPAPSDDMPSLASGPFQLDLHDEPPEASTASLPPIRTEGQTQERTPTKGAGASPLAAGGSSRTLPLTPIGVSAPADLGGQFAAAAGDSPRLISPALSEQTLTAPAPPAAPSAAGFPSASPPPPLALSRTSPPPQQQSQQAQQQAQQPVAQPVPAAVTQPPPPAVDALKATTESSQDQPVAGEAKKSQKEMTKAERRALQEAQRAAKAAAKPLPKQGSGGNLAKQGISARQGSAAAEESKAAADAKAKPGGKPPLLQKGVSVGKSAAAELGAAAPPRAKVAEMFAHLPAPKTVTLAGVAEQRGPPVPLAAVKLGLQYADGTIRGGNARCTAMLQMFMHVIQDFRTPAGREFAKEFSPALNNIINFLVSCRPLSVSMGNAIKAVKAWLEKMKVQPPGSDQLAKDFLLEKMADYLEQKIRFADRMLVKHAIAKIQDGDTVLTYAYSSVVAAALVAARKAGKQFEVVVVDSRPLLEGRRMLTTLLNAGITCEYCHLGALSYQITEVDKVFLGAASVLSNGAVLSRVGTAAVALMATAQRVPVLVCCESYKFHDRVQLDSITHNELLPPAGLTQVQDRPDVPELKNWETSERLHLVNLSYDLMPADLVTVVITEMGAVPPTSVAVILREAQRDTAALL